MFTPVSCDNFPIVSPSARATVIEPMEKPLDPVVTIGSSLIGMTIKQERAMGSSERGTTLIVAGGLLGALAASSCCLLPVVLFGLGISGAWIENFTQLAPYQPYFLAVTGVFLGTGYWFVNRASRRACVEVEACARPCRSGWSGPHPLWRRSWSSLPSVSTSWHHCFSTHEMESSL